MVDKDGAEEDEDGSYDRLEGEEHTSDQLPPLPAADFDPTVYLRECGVGDDVFGDLGKMANSTRQCGYTLLPPDYTISPDEVATAMAVIASDARIFAPDVRSQVGELKNQALVLPEFASAFTLPPSRRRGTISVSGIGRKPGCARWTKRICRGRYETSSSSKSMSPSSFRSSVRSGPLTSVPDTPLFAHEGKGETDVRFGQGVAAASKQSLKKGFAAVMKAPTDPSYQEYEPGDDDSSSPGWADSLTAGQRAIAYRDIFESIITDISLSKTVAPELDVGVLHTDLREFGRSVLHAVTINVLHFFGMPEAWLKWFTTYLRVRSRDSSGAISIAERGTPFGLRRIHARERATPHPPRHRRCQQGRSGDAPLPQ